MIVACLGEVTMGAGWVLDVVDTGSDIREGSGASGEDVLGHLARHVRQAGIHARCSNRSAVRGRDPRREECRVEIVMCKGFSTAFEPNSSARARKLSPP